MNISKEEMRAKSFFKKKSLIKLIRYKMKIIHTIVSVLVILAMFTGPETKAQSITNYIFSSTTRSYTPLSSGTQVSWNYVDFTPAIPLGFNFIYMGQKYNQVYATWGGFLTFNSQAPSYSPDGGNSLRNSISQFRPLIAPLWDEDLWSTTGIYRTDGTAGSRVFTIEWSYAHWGSGTDASVSFQIILYESTGKIEFAYKQEAPSIINSSGASIGITAADTGAGKFLSLDGTGSNPNVSSVTDFDTLKSRPATNQVYAFTPAGTTQPADLTFTNIVARGMDLHWTDASSDELWYAIYCSTDGTSFTYLDSAGVNSNHYSASFLNSNTLYYWKVYAVREGLSAPLSGSQSTVSPSLSGIKTVGPAGDYPNITAALTAINLNGLAGNLILELKSTYTSSSETFPIVIHNLSNGADRTLTIRPASGASNLLISGAATSAVIMLNEGDYVIMDGRPGGTGLSRHLTIQNTDVTGGSAISFTNDAANNIIRYCKLNSTDTTSSRGVVFFRNHVGYRRSGE